MGDATMLTHREAERLVKKTKGPLGAAYQCPHCRYGLTVKKPYTWGDVKKAVADVARHIMNAHPGVTP